MKEEAQAEKNGEATIGRKQKGKLQENCQENCEKLTPIGARTRGHEIKSPALYQLSYGG